MPLEDLHDPLQRCASLPRGYVGNARMPLFHEPPGRLGAGLEPVRVTDRVAVLPFEEVLVGQQDAGRRVLVVGNGRQDVQVEALVPRGPAAAPRFKAVRPVGVPLVGSLTRVSL